MDPGTEIPCEFDQNSVFLVQIFIVRFGCSITGPWTLKSKMRQNAWIHNGMRLQAMDPSHGRFKIQILPFVVCIFFWCNHKHPNVKGHIPESHIRETEKYDSKSKLIDIFSKRSLLLLYKSQISHSIIKGSLDAKVPSYEVLKMLRE